MKIFISHSSVDKELITEFVDRILKLSCGIHVSDITYTSLPTTGVPIGGGIPSFIKQALIDADMVLFMISENYKRSEICLNEMGAAWALDKNTISILLPNVSFQSLGWLTSFNKAIKIDESEDLDSFYEIISIPPKDVSEWNRQKKAFLEKCSIYAQCRSPRVEEGDMVPQNSMILKVFDVEFLVRAVSEGKYQYQINLRLRATADLTLKEVYLVNKDRFTGNFSKEERELKLLSFIDYGTLDINRISVGDYRDRVVEAFDKEKKPVMDYNILKNSQISISFMGQITTIRECDGNIELPVNHWSLKVSFNVDEAVEIPIVLTFAQGGDVLGYYWHN